MRGRRVGRGLGRIDRDRHQGVVARRRQAARRQRRRSDRRAPRRTASDSDNSRGRGSPAAPRRTSRERGSAARPRRATRVQRHLRAGRRSPGEPAASLGAIAPPARGGGRSQQRATSACRCAGPTHRRSPWLTSARPAGQPGMPSLATSRIACSIGMWTDARRAILPAGAVQLLHLLGARTPACRRAGSAAAAVRVGRERLREPAVVQLLREQPGTTTPISSSSVAPISASSRSMSRKVTSFGSRLAGGSACPGSNHAAPPRRSASERPTARTRSRRRRARQCRRDRSSRPAGRATGSTVHQLRSTSLATSSAATPSSTRRERAAAATASARTAPGSGRARSAGAARPTRRASVQDTTALRSRDRTAR